MNELSSPQPIGVGRRWHTTTFRWLSGYAAIFAASMTLLVGVIAWAATNAMEHDTDDIMAWQLIYFDSIPDVELAGAIHSRLEHERMHTNFYGLFTADGRHIAGDVVHLPPRLTFDRNGRTLRHTLELVDGQQSPIVRAMCERRTNGTILLVARDLTHILKMREAVIRALVIGGILVLAAGVAGGLVLSVRQLRRVREIRRVTQRIARGDLNQRLPIGGRDELDMLAHLVNHMLEEVERLMSEVKGACDGIAHDLRTPLAHVHTLLGRIADRTAQCGDDGVAALLTRARSETDTLLERFRAMLRISEIGALQRRGGFGRVDLRLLVEELGELYEPLAESRNMNWTLLVETVEEIHGDRALLFEAFSNLLDNAIKFSPQGGSVGMTLRATPWGPAVEVYDDGPGIPANERDAVLQRFYRSEQGRYVPGSGLGLSIVSAVMRVHDFTLHIDDAKRHDARTPGAGPGTKITVECWPRALA